MKPRIFVALSTFSEFSNKPIEMLRGADIEYSVNPLKRRLTAEEIINFAKDAEVIIAGVEPYDEGVLSSLGNLKCISRCGVGIDNIDAAKAKNLNIAIKNTPDAVTLAVAELTVAMIFNLLKRMSHHNHLMRSRKWQKLPGTLLSGKKVGILGLGRIGKKVALMLKALNAQLYASDVYPDLEWARDKGITIVSEKSLLKDCDIVTIHVSVNKKNKFFLGKDAIYSLKKGSLLINTSRGALLDENALYEALKSEHLSGAALDVYCEEPYKGPLCDLNNVVLTPHVATLTRESRTQMEIEAVRNAFNFLGI